MSRLFFHKFDMGIVRCVKLGVMEEAKIWLEKIKKEMASRMMTASELHQISDVSEATISRWFSTPMGRKPSPLYRKAVEEALGLSVAPVREGPDVALQNALFNHPDITHEQAEHEWLCLRMLIDYNKRQRR